MSIPLQPVRGTRDVIGEEVLQFEMIQSVARSIAERYGFTPMLTPIFEFTEVFKRSLGDTSDVVTKEMYSFETKGGDHITLRPEFTAQIVRAVISSGLTQSLPLKLYTAGPLFRYERPEKGRYRQFSQINFELMGVAEPLADIEIIALAQHILDAIGAKEITLELNSLGDHETRTRYRTALVAYLKDFAHVLSEDSKTRLTRNPMRILDSKDEEDQKILQNAPSISDYYTQEAKTFLIKVCEGLSQLGIAYTHNTKLVRGLDYYCHTAFEFTSSVFGVSKAILAGGRYDGLMPMMGGPEMPAIGFAGGIERLMAVSSKTVNMPRPIAIIPIGGEAETLALTLTQQLRNDGFRIELGYSGNVGKRLKRAHKANAELAIIFGEDEIKALSVTVRHLDHQKEERIALDQLQDFLRKIV